MAVHAKEDSGNARHEIGHGSTSDPRKVTDITESLRRSRAHPTGLTDTLSD
ncbi:hypothetical protein SAMN04487820_10849 [Actinopolyspora mzabensis]|uniref:Uncharacterized protein n=1 Tax=Actinopolyspora mzabensis TaxID=995066 RepID=A0A1G9C1B8_ACTMZ|nr:hypothetical protein SAMN04487820_10849 [Actinopolyspora mzabensis]